MRKLSQVVVIAVALLLVSRYGPTLHAWATQFEPEASSAERRAASEVRAETGRQAPRAALTAPLAQVVDGDTITVRLGGRTETVRYIGVQAVGQSATEINRRLLAGGPVRLELDLEQRDPAGRLLAYVHAGDVMINAELVAEGAARVAPESPNRRHRDLLLDLEHQARILKVGMWGARTARN